MTFLRVKRACRRFSGVDFMMQIPTNLEKIKYYLASKE